jgi:hypothetical protein
MRLGLGRYCVNRLARHMKELLDWPRASQLRALANARAAATECCRRRIERDEVMESLRLLGDDIPWAAREARG